MKKILIIDIETTGFLNAGGKIVEIGIVELNLSNGNKRTVYDSVVHERPLTLNEVKCSWIVSNGYMNVKEIQHSPQLKDVFNDVQNIINKYPLGATAFNNKFDFSFMENRGFVFPKKLDCPMKICTPICKMPFKNGRSGNKFPTAQEAFDFFFGKTDYIEKHRGADDAYHEASIVYELYKQKLFNV